MVLLLASNARADEWSTADTWREAAFQTLLAVDWAQTRSFLRDPQYAEGNPIIGEHPGNARLTSFVALTAAGHLAISYFLPETRREYFQYLSIGIEAAAVTNNFSIGISASF